jgi:hypothetical protein
MIILGILGLVACLLVGRGIAHVARWVADRAHRRKIREADDRRVN